MMDDSVLLKRSTVMMWSGGGAGGVCFFLARSCSRFTHAIIYRLPALTKTDERGISHSSTSD